MPNKIKDSLLNMKNKMLKNRFKLNKTKDIDDIIHEFEIKKAELLIKLGMLTYKKIRCGSLNDETYEYLANEIFELDKIIYSNKLDLEERINTEDKAICKCGHTFDIDDNFCAECGSKIEIEEILEELVICTRCNCELDLDSNYCVCCGSPII